MSERKEQIPNEAVVVVVSRGDHRKQPRAGAGRAISFGDGIISGCVDVYVRCCIFLLKRTPAVAARERDGNEGGMGRLTASGRSSVAGRVRVFEWGTRVSSGARMGAESADSSGAKRFAWCSAATLMLRGMRCDAMRIVGTDEGCEDDDCDVGGRDAVASASVGVVVGECDFDFDGCPLGTEPLRVLGPAGPSSLFSLRSCIREHSAPVQHT